MAMNAVVTPHQPVCLYSATGEEGEPPDRLHWLSGGPPEAWNILIASRQRAQGRCFSDFRHSEAFVFFADRARYEKRSSSTKGLLLGVFFSTEGTQGKNTFDKMIQKLAEVTFSFGSTPRDEAQWPWRQCKMTKVNSFDPYQAEKEKTRWTLLVLIACKQMFKGMNVILPGLCPVPINR
jgi:hypothetical protein